MSLLARCVPSCVPTSIPPFSHLQIKEVPFSSVLLSQGCTHKGHLPRTETLLSLLSLESSCSVRNPESHSFWSPTSPHWTWEFQLPRLGERRELSILLGLAPSFLSCLGQVFISLGLSFSSMKNKNSTILHPRAAKTAGLSWNHVLICVQGSFSVLQH